MTAPSKKLRDLVFTRDGFACVECGSPVGLEWGHRQSSGMGGRGSKAPELTAADGITQCARHNAAAEAEGQGRALEMGHKVTRNATRPLCLVPYHESRTNLWWLPAEDGTRLPLPDAEAVAIIRHVNFKVVR